MLLSSYFLLILCFTKSDGHYERPITYKNRIIGPYGDARRILNGAEITDTRPYMVYLRPSTETNSHPNADVNWVCGGVIVNPRLVLTSAACIEDIVHFYVVYGTYRWLPPSETNECIQNSATRAIWKCVPKTYNFDGKLFNNIRWMVNDIAVIKTEDTISFTKRVRGCDFIPDMVSYNNQSQDLEEPGTLGYVIGWGSTEQYTDVIDIIARTNINSPVLMEAQVKLIQKSSCQSNWLPRYHTIIEKYMICGESMSQEDMPQGCEDDVECRKLVYSEELQAIRKIPVDYTTNRRASHISDHELIRSMLRDKKLRKIKQKARKADWEDGNGVRYGGFCENDHGGPLLAGHGRGTTVIGIATAFRTANNSKTCLGPFLYTSVWNNRHLINCAIFSKRGVTCTTVLRDSSTVLDVENIKWPPTLKDPPKKEVSRQKPLPILRSDNKTEPRNVTIISKHRVGLVGRSSNIGHRRPDNPKGSE